MVGASVVRGVKRVGDAIEDGEGALLEDRLRFVVLQREPGSDAKLIVPQRGKASNQ